MHIYRDHNSNYFKNPYTVFYTKAWAAIGCSENGQPTRVTVHYSDLRSDELLYAGDGLL